VKDRRACVYCHCVLPIHQLRPSSVDTNLDCPANTSRIVTYLILPIVKISGQNHLLFPGPVIKSIGLAVSNKLCAFIAVMHRLERHLAVNRRSVDDGEFSETSDNSTIDELFEEFSAQADDDVAPSGDQEANLVDAKSLSNTGHKQSM